MAEYKGGCQCGALRYQVEVSLEAPVICNCSRCSKVGAVLVFAPAAQFRLETDAAAGRSYTFHNHVIRHIFCATCGVQSYSEAALRDGTAMVAINARCLDGVDGHALAARAKLVDGAAR